MGNLNSLYSTLNSDFANEMNPSDWTNSDGSYNPNNKWNTSTTTGTIAHLIQPNNTLGAEVDIAAQGTVIRKDPNGNTITDKTRLINCSRYGNANRNSDPTVSFDIPAKFKELSPEIVIQIGDNINKLARGGKIVSIANPVAIYIQSVNFGTLKLDQEGTADNMVPVPDGTFSWRGDISNSKGLRLKIKIPDGVVGTGPDNKGQQLTVSDIMDTGNGQYIQYGAQFADYISMGVNGVGITGGTPATALPCPTPPLAHQHLSLKRAADSGRHGHGKRK